VVAVKVLVTGAAGVVGTEVCRLLSATGHDPIRVSTREMGESGWVRWRIGDERAPASLRRGWDAVVHAAASTRWTMSREEATSANIDTTRAVLALAGTQTHFVHVSTAYAGHGGPALGPFDGYRNGYEWSKARCEELVRARTGPTTIVRPPLILGCRDTGAISRFSGPYTLLQALVSGLAAVVVGEPTGYAEIAPVDQVAEVVVTAALTPPVSRSRVEVIAAGERCLQLKDMIGLILGVLNNWRVPRGLPPVAEPPTLSLDRWRRFYLPLAREHLSLVQNEAIALLGMFEAYTSMSAPFEPTSPVLDPASVLTRSVRYWIDAKPRLAMRTPQPWHR
jgi:nucleoside-diphosphate-sugar epimerase